MEQAGKKGLIIAIDGPSAAGKSTVGKLLARRYNYTYIDTGAMYRALALKAIQAGIADDDEASLTDLLHHNSISLHNVSGEECKGSDCCLNLRVFWNAEDVTSLIRTQQVGMMASRISALPGVRLAMVEIQRQIGRQGAVVMDGRDIGSFVFPDADKKFFLDASLEERARRRFEELRSRGMEVSFPEVMADLAERDRNDRSRQLAPLVKTEDAIVIDSTHRSIEEVGDIMARKIGI
ncbi:MAG: (d)CMP kinase [bacterium]